MIQQYLVTPDYLIADIGKVGSSTIVRAVYNAHYSHIPKRVIVGADMSNQPDDGSRDRVERTAEVDRPVLLPVRDPVERFLSAFVQMRFDDVDAALDRLESGETFRVRRDGEALTLLESYHFRPVTYYTHPGGEFRLFRFPDHLDDLATTAGLETPLPVVNDAGRNHPPKPTLTAEQTARIEAIYAEDKALFDSIREAGQTRRFEKVVPPPTPEEIAEAKSAKLAAIEADYNNFLSAGVEINGVTLAAGDSDRKLFTEGLVLLREAGLPDDAPQVIADQNGNPIELPLAQLRQLLVGYGAAIQQAWTAKLTRSATVKAASTLEEVEAA